MNAIIVEDEILAAENLQLLIKKVDPNIVIIAQLESVRGSVKWLSENKCDLIFMDIQLSDGNSFSIFEQIEIKTPVIFTTAYDQYAIKAFKHYSIDYLLKPINEQELKVSLEKYTKYFQEAKSLDIKSILDAIKHPAQYQERFLVNAGMKLKTIKTLDIAFFYVKDKYTFLCTKENRHYSMDLTLERLQELLNPKCFFRINRQYIVNIESIENMFVVSKSRLKLNLNPKTNEDVIVSFNNMNDFRLWLNR